jgi:hypothetical protein
LVRVSLRVDHAAFLLTNAVLGLTAVSALGILYHLTDFSSFLRAVIWAILVSLCLHMVFTYVRNALFPPLVLPEQTFVNDSVDKEKANTNTKVRKQISKRELAKV